MEIRVRFVDGGVGLRRHFCTERRCIVHIDAGGLHEDAPLFCPLCGGLTTTEAPQARNRFDQKLPARGVAVCEHGDPDMLGWSARHPGLSGGRLSQLQTAHPGELRLIGTFLAMQQHESELHSMFTMHHVRGEWFRYVPEIVEHFDKQ